MLPRILIVEDDSSQLQMLASLLSKHLPAEILTASKGSAALTLLQEGGTLPDLMLVDMRMPEMDGFTLLRKISPLLPQLPVIIITAFGDVNSAVQAMKLGAVDFLQKQESKERIITAIRNALQASFLRKEVLRLSNRDTSAARFQDILGSSKAFKEAIVVARKAATSNVTVLIKGESGVGKELFARAIHGESPRALKPFIAVNCGAIPENLIESTLFGHEKGAFTGATSASTGKFREADGGTLFLDEVSELSPQSQVRLLRALQEREVEPVGAARPVKVDVRIIAATNRKLKEDVESGRFREDLYYRLSTYPLSLPSLHARGKEDILLLAHHFLRKFAAEERCKIDGFTAGAETLLSSYNWPGNIRQLENTIRRALLLTQDHILDVQDFPGLSNSGSNVEALPLPVAKTRVALTGDNGEFRALKDIEAEVLRAALIHYRWHISQVARKLGIGRSTLYRRIEDLGIDIERPTGEAPVDVLTDNDEESQRRQAYII